MYLAAKPALNALNEQKKFCDGLKEKRSYNTNRETVILPAKSCIHATIRLRLSYAVLAKKIFFSI